MYVNDHTWSFKIRQIDPVQFSSTTADNVSSTVNMSIGEIFAARTENLGALSEEKGRQRVRDIFNKNNFYVKLFMKGDMNTGRF